jgi:hypothetical protein
MSKGAVFIALAGLVGAASSVPAQNSTTSCYGSGPWVNCDTRAAPPSGGAVAGFARGLSDSLERDGGMAALMERRRQRREERLRQSRTAEAGKLVASGKCDEARNYALTAGDFDLVQKIASLCAARLTR